MDADRWDDLIDRFEDGDASAEDRAEIERLLEEAPDFRRRFVRRSLMEVHAHRAFAGLESSAARPARRLRAFAPRASWVPWAVAASILIAAALYYVGSRPRPVPVRPEEARRAPGPEAGPRMAPRTPEERPAPVEAPPREVPRPGEPRPKVERPPEVAPPPPPPDSPVPPVPPPAPPTVAEAPAPVVESVEGRASVAAGVRIGAGEEVRTAGFGSRAVVRLPDGSRLVLEGEARLREVGEKSACLESGTLQVEAARQDPKRPLRIATPHGEARVTGTRFTVVAAPDLMRVEVTEGRVRLSRARDGAAVDLAAGQSAVAAPGAALAPLPLRAPIPAAGLALWLRADAGIEGGTVARWADQSGQGRDAVQPEASRRPLWVPFASAGRPALRFDGKDDSLAASVPVNGLSALTIVIVSSCAADRTGGSNHGENAALLWEETEPWGWVYLSPFQSTVRWRFGTTQKDNLPSFPRTEPAADVFTVTTAVKNGPSEALYVQGRPVASETGKRRTIRGTGDVLTVGGNPRGTFFAGSIAEVLVYARALQEAERQRVEAWLLQKYFPAGDRR